VQVVVGVVMANGWPIAHHVFPGNTADRATLQAVVDDLDKRFGLRRVVLVADRGMVSPDNLEFLSERKFRYLVGMAGRRNREAAAVLAALREEGTAWQAVDEENRLQEVRLPGQPVRYLVVESAERKAYEQLLREKSMGRASAALERIERAVAEGRLKDPAKIGARAGRVLKTDDADMTADDAVEAYKQLATVEAGFRDLKDVIDMRPIWHKTERRICAHIFVATLALFLKRTLRRHLDRAGVNLSATDALAALRSIGVDELDLDGEPHTVVSSGSRDARRVVKALGLREIAPPERSPGGPKREPMAV